MIAGLATGAFLVVCIGYGLSWVYDRDPEGRDR